MLVGVVAGGRRFAVDVAAGFVLPAGIFVGEALVPRTVARGAGAPGGKQDEQQAGLDAQGIENSIKHAWLKVINIAP